MQPLGDLLREGDAHALDQVAVELLLGGMGSPVVRVGDQVPGFHCLGRVGIPLDRLFQAGDGLVESARRV